MSVKWKYGLLSHKKRVLLRKYPFHNFEVFLIFFHFLFLKLQVTVVCCIRHIFLFLNTDFVGSINTRNICLVGAKGCALTAFVDSWHVYLLIGNVLAYKHPLSATIWHLFHQFRAYFLWNGLHGGNVPQWITHIS
jgi:hypothetical protein